MAQAPSSHASFNRCMLRFLTMRLAVSMTEGKWEMIGLNRSCQFIKLLLQWLGAWEDCRRSVTSPAHRKRIGRS